MKSSPDADLDQVLPVLYAELRRLARLYLSRERPGHTLQPTALVHEAYLRLASQYNVNWSNRAQVLGIAAQMMRRVLANHAASRNRAKRDGGRQRVLLEDTMQFAGGDSILDFLELDRSMEKLEALDARQARVVELRFFAGLTEKEISDVLGVSLPTVKRDWASARLWLMHDLGGDPSRDAG